MADAPTYQHFINGEFVDSDSGTTFESLNPCNQEVVAHIQEGTASDVHKAIDAARAAFDDGPWGKTTGEDRANALNALAGAIGKNTMKWAELEARDSGSVKQKAMFDMMSAAGTLKSFAHLAKLPQEEQIELKGGMSKSLNFVRKEPIGVAGQIIPWNFPLVMMMWKIAPALAAGCTVVLKPAPETSCTAMEFCKVLAESDLPKGVVNVVTGFGQPVGEEIARNPGTDKIAFTGSTEVGKIIMRLAADSLKKVTLELGGKSANIVCDDADMELAVDGSIWGTFFHQGQACESGTRILVSEKKHDEFVERLTERTKKIKVGDSLDPKSNITAVISEKQFNRVMKYIDTGKEEGAHLQYGGHRVEGDGMDKGWYISPTIFTEVDNKMTIAQEEIFGPVVCVIKYKDEDDAIQIANDSVYGLGGGVWSKDADRARKMAEQIRAGTVWVNEWHALNPNAPFGGYKQSGIGREFGHWGLDEYFEIKHMHIDPNATRAGKMAYDMIAPRS